MIMNPAKLETARLTVIASPYSQVDRLFSKARNGPAAKILALLDLGLVWIARVHPRRNAARHTIEVGITHLLGPYRGIM